VKEYGFMYAADNPQIQQLFDASARDEHTIAFPVPDEVFGFHAQQAVEKLYKALSLSVLTVWNMLSLTV
jgi:hypothetical protein